MTKPTEDEYRELCQTALDYERAEKRIVKLDDGVEAALNRVYDAIAELEKARDRLEALQ